MVKPSLTISPAQHERGYSLGIEKCTHVEEKNWGHERYKIKQFLILIHDFLYLYHELRWCNL